MKKLSILAFIIAFIIYGIDAQNDLVIKNYSHNANLLNKSQLRYSLFSFSEYGVTDNITLVAHPLWVFLSPDISLKWKLKEKGNTRYSLIHGISCPTPILNLISRSGTGGIISPEFDIPFMISIKNGILANKKINDQNILFGGITVEFAMFNNSLEPGSTIDLPIISPRLNVFYKNLGVEFNLGAEGNISEKFDYYTQTKLFLFPLKDKEFSDEYGNTNKLFGEITGMVFWNLKKKCKLGFGGKLCYGNYPFGDQWHLLPAIDFVKYTR